MNAAAGEEGGARGWFFLFSFSFYKRGGLEMEDVLEVQPLPRKMLPCLYCGVNRQVESGFCSEAHAKEYVKGALGAFLGDTSRVEGMFETLRRETRFLRQTEACRGFATYQGRYKPSCGCLPCWEKWKGRKSNETET